MSGNGRHRLEFMRLPGETQDELKAKASSLAAEWGVTDVRLRSLDPIVALADSANFFRSTQRSKDWPFTLFAPVGELERAQSGTVSF